MLEPFIVAFEVLAILFCLGYVGYKSARSKKIPTKVPVISETMTDADIYEHLRVSNHCNAELKNKIEQLETEYAALCERTRNHIKHDVILAAIHAEQKAHVKALFDKWQTSKKSVFKCRPGSKEEAMKKRAAQKARTEWKFANTHYLKHFGNYAP